MEAHAIWRGGFETRLEDGRGHAVIVDEPVEDGGRDSGTSPIELLVLSLAGCMTAIFRVVAEKRKLRFEGLSISLRAERAEGAPTVEKVTGVAEVRTDAPLEEVESVVRLTLKSCPVGVLFEHGHVPVEVRARVLRPSPATGAQLPYEVPDPEWAL